MSRGHKRTVVLYTDARSFGGAEVHLALLANSLERHQPYVLLHERKVQLLLEPLLPASVPIKLVRRPAGKNDLVALGRLFATFLKLRVRHRRVTLHCHLPTPDSGFFAIVLGQAAGLPVVCTEHIRMTPKRPGVPRARRLMNRAADHEIAVSRAVADSLVKDHGQDPVKITVIPNGIDLSRYASPEFDDAAWTIRRRSTREKLGLSADAFVVGSVGRLDQQKNYSLLLDAVAQARLGSDWRIVIVGEGNQRQMLEEQTARLGLSSRVLLPGHLDNVPEVLPAFDLFVLTSRFEGLPLSLLEAMASGIPCLATAADGTREVIVDGANGILLPLDVAANVLAGCLSALTADPVLRSRLARAGARTVRAAHDMESMARRTELVYDRVLAAHGVR